MATRDRVHRPRWQVRAAGAALAAVAGLCLTTGSAQAATTEAAGWWSTTGSPLPVNPTAPQVAEGQLHVEGGPQGATAIAAVRWALSEGESSPVFTLTPAQGSFLPADAVVLACPATGPWEEANGGAMAAAPTSDCTTQAAGTVAPDGSSVEFDLSPLLKGTSLDVVLQPGPASAFSLTFDRPAPEALVTTPAPATASEPVGTSEPSTSTGSETSTAPAATSDSSSTAPATSGASTTSFSSPITGGSTSFSTPALAPPTAPMPAEATTQAAPASGTTAGTGNGSAAAATSNKASDSGSNDRAKQLGVVVLLAGLAVLGWAWMATDPSGMGRLKEAVASRPVFTRRPVTQ